VKRGPRPVYREAIVALLSQDPLRSDQAIADDVGCTRAWVCIVRRQAGLWTATRISVRGGKSYIRRLPCRK